MSKNNKLYKQYFEYVRKIRDNPTAVTVKLADLAHNMDETRIIGNDAITDEQKEYWRHKYVNAKKILTEVVEQ